VTAVSAPPGLGLRASLQGEHQQQQQRQQQQQQQRHCPVPAEFRCGSDMRAVAVAVVFPCRARLQGSQFLLKIFDEGALATGFDGVAFCFEETADGVQSSWILWIEFAIYFERLLARVQESAFCHRPSFQQPCLRAQTRGAGSCRPPVFPSRFSSVLQPCLNSRWSFCRHQDPDQGKGAVQTRELAVPP
jgi:hypothetical protein